MAEDQSNNPQSEQDRRRGLVAVPALAAFLAVWHQQQQEAIAARVTDGLALLWPILSYSNVDATAGTWLHAAMLQVNHGFEQSSAVAAEFVQGTLWAHDPEAEVLPAITAEFPAAEVENALKATGPVKIKQLTPGPEADVMAVAEKKSTGAGVTRALDGGRQQVVAQVEAMATREAEPEPQVETPNPVIPEGSTPAEHAEAPKTGPTIVEDLTRADELAQRRKKRRAIGYARFTDNKPCYFCAMLASLGAFFLSADAFKASDKKYQGPGTAKVHDHCRCSLRPVFSKKNDMDARANDFLKQWGEAQKKRKNGETDINAFRREYIAPPDYQLADVLSVDERRNAIDAARSNRDVFLGRGLGEDSPQVKYWSDALRNLEAV